MVPNELAAYWEIRMNEGSAVAQWEGVLAATKADIHHLVLVVNAFCGLLSLWPRTFCRVECS